MKRRRDNTERIVIGVNISKEVADMLKAYAEREEVSLSAALEKRLKTSLKAVNKKYLIFKKSLNDVYPENVGIANDLKKQIEKIIDPDRNKNVYTEKLKKLVDN